MTTYTSRVVKKHTIKIIAAPAITALAVAAVSMALPGCGSSSVPPPATASGGSSTNSTTNKTVSYDKVIDLTHVVSADIPIWPGDPTPTFTELAKIDKEGYFLRSFSIGEHSATHMNAGNSFFAGGTGINADTPDSLIRPAVVIDISQQAGKNPNYALTTADVEAWEATNGKISEGSMVLVNSGWQAKWTDPKAFFNKDAKDVLHFPGISGETAKWLLAERKISVVGIDTHGADPGIDSNYQTNNAVLKAGGIVLECLANLDRLPVTGATIVMAPLPLKGGSGSPVRVLAMIK